MNAWLMIAASVFLAFVSTALTIYSARNINQMGVVLWVASHLISVFALIFSLGFWLIGGDRLVTWGASLLITAFMIMWGFMTLGGKYSVDGDLD